MSDNRLPDPRVEHTRRVILRAALEEFARTGYAGFRMESVAVLARIGRSTLYRHWPDKTALIADALETLNVQPDPARELPDGSARAHVELMLAHLAGALTDSQVSACIPALVHAAANDAAIGDFFHAYSARRRKRLTETIAAGVAGREFSPRINAEAASVALSGAVFYRRLMSPDPPDALFIASLVETVLGG
jgi:TetR/AcrR family transcriptional regulator, regulator of autoinduction and epiphytic fitness